MKIKKIEKVQYDGDVYNLELKSSIDEDDLFWIESTSDVITHNCFPKDVNAILFEANQKGLSMPTLLGAHTTNQIVRTDKDWEKMKGRAVSTKKSVEIDGVQ